MSVKKISDYTRLVDSWNSKGEKIQTPVFDYWKIWNDTEPNQAMKPIFYIIMSERGKMTKTTQAKVTAKRIWDLYKLKTIWMMNDEELIKNEKLNHLEKPIEFFPELFDDGMDIVGDQVYAHKNIYEDVINDKGKVINKKLIKKAEWYTKFVVTSKAKKEKGSRNDYGFIVWDEFNVADRMIRTTKTKLLANLMGTADDPLNRNRPNKKPVEKIVVHANFETLNDQLLIDWGITSLKDEVTDIKDPLGRVIGRVISPIYDKSYREEFEKDNIDNPMYWALKTMGQSDHVFFNVNTWDYLNFVNKEMITLPYKSFFIVRVKEQYYQIRLCESPDVGGIMYVIPYVVKTGDTVYAIHPSDIMEGVVYVSNLRKSIKRFVGASKIYFRNSVIRDNIITRLRGN